SRRVTIEGPDLPLLGGPVTSFALLVHEFATNAAKYGALSTEEGMVRIICAQDDDHLRIVWQERGGPPVIEVPETTGFGDVITRSTVEKQLGGSVLRD